MKVKSFRILARPSVDASVIGVLEDGTEVELAYTHHYQFMAWFKKGLLDALPGMEVEAARRSLVYSGLNPDYSEEFGKA